MSKLALSHFCDDVRYEVGYKNTLVGVYGSELNVGMAPYVIPQMCILTFFNAPIEEEIKHLEMQVFYANNLVHTDTLTQEFLEESLKKIKEIDNLGEPLTYYTLNMNVMVKNLVVEKSSILKVILLADGEEIPAGKLRIKVQPQESLTQQA